MDRSELITISKDRVFSLTNSAFSYLFRVSAEGILEHLHFGSPIDQVNPAMFGSRRIPRALMVDFEAQPNYSLSDTAQEYPVFGTSDFRFPAFHARNINGNTACVPRFRSYRLTEDKPALDGLPHSRSQGSESLVLTLADEAVGVEIELTYTIYHDYGVLCRSSKIRNGSDQPLILQHAFSSALNLPAQRYELLHLHGYWGAEFTEQRTPLPNARFVIESARGASSAAHNPFVALLESGACEDAGQVYGTTLLYSGNYCISTEVGDFGEVRLLAGINPFNFEWLLEPGESFQTPEVLHVYAANGLREMSSHWHHFIRDRISPDQFRRRPRPTYLNTWEAAYFEIDEARVLALAERARSLGVEMLVLDDGWFQGRKSDASSLGDWHPDAERFPNGIVDLATRVRSEGLKFGLWFEPEMVSPESDLYRKHPDWVLQVPGRKSSLGRNQLTLDLSRGEVVDFLFEMLNGYLGSGQIDYIKWDMNRCMSEVGSSVLPANRQLEVPHRYMLGLYNLLERLTSRYPDVLFENCASGGNRFDLGMLRYMAQGWVSDMSEPIDRLSIINGASYLYPLDTMAAYIGPSPSHQNGRETSLQTRFLAGLFCAARGISLGVDDLTSHAAELRDLMALATKSAADMVGGAFYRLVYEENDVCWQYSCASGGTVYVAYFHLLARTNEPLRYVRLVNLDPDQAYVLDEDGESFSGKALMNAGIRLPHVSMDQSSSAIRYMPRGDFSSYLFIFRAR